MKKLFRFLLIAIAILLILGLIAFLAIKYMPDRNMDKLKADHVVTAAALYKSYESNEAASNQKYMDRIIEVSGKISEISEDRKGATVVGIRDAGEMSGVLCTLKEGHEDIKAKYKKGDKVTIRGACTGMLMDVVLNKCVVVD